MPEKEPDAGQRALTAGRRKVLRTRGRKAGWAVAHALTTIAIPIATLLGFILGGALAVLTAGALTLPMPGTVVLGIVGALSGLAAGLVGGVKLINFAHNRVRRSNAKLNEQKTDLSRLAKRIQESPALVDAAAGLSEPAGSSEGKLSEGKMSVVADDGRLSFSEDESQSAAKTSTES